MRPDPYAWGADLETFVLVPGLAAAYWVATRFHAAPRWRVVAFGVGLALLAGVIFGLIPALRTTRAIAENLGRGVAGSLRASRLRNVLVVTQVAVSLVLLVGGALSWQSLKRARRIRTFHARIAIHQPSAGMMFRQATNSHR